MSTWTSSELDALAATADRVAHIQAGTITSEVTVTPAGATARAEIDQAYRAKYGSFGRAYVNPMTAGSAAATTLQLVPER